MEDLLKLSSTNDPIIFKGPFQVMKEEYFGIIKRYKVEKVDDEVRVNFTYDAAIPIKK